MAVMMFWIMLSHRVVDVHGNDRHVHRHICHILRLVRACALEAYAGSPGLNGHLNFCRPVGVPESPSSCILADFPQYPRCKAPHAGSRKFDVSLTQPWKCPALMRSPAATVSPTHSGLANWLVCFTFPLVSNIPHPYLLAGIVPRDAI